MLVSWRHLGESSDIGRSPANTQGKIHPDRVRALAKKWLTAISGQLPIKAAFDVRDDPWFPALPAVERSLHFNSRTGATHCMDPEPLQIAPAISGLVCFLPFLLLVIASSVFWIWMLVDCLTNESSQGNEKIVWLLVIVLLHGVGAFLYLVVRRPQRKRELGR